MGYVSLQVCKRGIQNNRYLWPKIKILKKKLLQFANRHSAKSSKIGCELKLIKRFKAYCFD